MRYVNRWDSVTYVYFDESGDLGFDFTKHGTSRVFSIAFLMTKNKRPVSSLVKKVFINLPPAVKRKNSGVLHASYEKPSTIEKLLTKLATKDVRIATMRLDKKNVLIASNPNELYTDIVISLVNRLYAAGAFDDSDSVNLIASQRNTSKSLNARFTESIANSALNTKLGVSIVKPSEDKCLQAVDFVSWAFWQKYACGDSTFSDLIASRVFYEYEMYR